MALLSTNPRASFYVATPFFQIKPSHKLPYSTPVVPALSWLPSSNLRVDRGFELRTEVIKSEANHTLLHRPTYKSKPESENCDEKEVSNSDESAEQSKSDVPVRGQWKVKESQIHQAIMPLMRFVKSILHSNRYKDGERLRPEDEKGIVERILPYHPYSEDKIGRGVKFIMVGRHPKYECSRCLFIVRKDGEWIDFSYQKCLMGFIRKNYPSSAEKFIRRRFRLGRQRVP